MRKLNAFALALSLITLCVTSTLMLPNRAESRSRGSVVSGLNPTTIYDYETTIGTGGGANAIRLSYDPVTEKLVIGLFENGDATVYVAEGVSDPVGTFALQQQDVYDDGTGLAYAPVGAISAEISRLDAAEAAFVVTYNPNSKGDYVASIIEETDLQHRYGVCSNPNGTGACDQVHNNREWWRCFVCCFYGGGCGA